MNVFSLMIGLNLLARPTTIHPQFVLSSHQSFGEVIQGLSTCCRWTEPQVFSKM